MGSLKTYFIQKQMDAASHPDIHLCEGQRLPDLLSAGDKNTLQKILSNKADDLPEDTLIQFQKSLIDIYVIAYQDRYNVPALQETNEAVVKDIKQATDLIKEGLIRKFLATKQCSPMDLPAMGYHGSPRSGIKNLDPEKGEGIGTWFFPEESASGVALFAGRSFFGRMQETEPAPTVYKAEVHSSKTAVFESEDEMRCLGLLDFFNASGSSFQPCERSEVRQALLRHGFDSIFLKDMGAFCILDAGNMNIIDEIDAAAKEVCERVPGFPSPVPKRRASFEH
jgi:hypothetical protein